MKDETLIKKVRFFSVTEYEAEAEFLRKEHQQGHCLVNLRFPGRYTFAPCVPEDVIYQLDFTDAKGRDKLDYLQLFQDCGWEYLFDRYGYSYFRKRAHQAKVDEKIFSDEESRLDMLKRIFKFRMVPLLIILFVTIIPAMMLLFHHLQDDTDQLVYVFWFCMYLTMMLCYSCLFLQFLKGMNRLKKRR